MNLKRIYGSADSRLSYSSEGELSAAVTKEFAAMAFKYPWIANLAATYCGVQPRAVKDWANMRYGPAGSNLICLLGMLQSLYRRGYVPDGTAPQFANDYQFNLINLIHKSVMSDKDIVTSFGVTVSSVRRRTFAVGESLDGDIVNNLKELFAAKLEKQKKLIDDWLSTLNLAGGGIYAEPEFGSRNNKDEHAAKPHPNDVKELAGSATADTVVCAIKILALHLPAYIRDSTPESRADLRKSIGVSQFFRTATGLASLCSETAFKESSSPIKGKG